MAPLSLHHEQYRVSMDLSIRKRYAVSFQKERLAANCLSQSVSAFCEDRVPLRPCSKT